MDKLTYGTHEIDFDSLPANSQAALAKRGLSHYMGNEQSAKVSAHFEDKPDATDEDKAAFKADCQKAAIEALKSGTIGSSSRGPKGTAAETIARQIAEKEIKDILGAAGLTFPTGDKKVKFGDGSELTRAELLSRRMTKHGERLMADANKELARRAREAAKAGGVESLL